ncbi:MAG: M20 family metallopeptidase [Bacteroidota bacterium]|nr:M20 family metallopeptidase [Bacteroidota bacterium]
MDKIKSKVQLLANRFFDEILEVRRYIHQYPELSFEEHNTSRYIAQKLAGWGITSKVVAGTGLIAGISGKSAGQEIVLRADIDALPIQEQAKLPYASENMSIMHACGHDVHAACVLGAGLILKEMSDNFSGRVRLLFQPGEELLPGGASKVLASGILDQPAPDIMIAQHVFPELPAGKVGFRAGQYMASTDEIYIEVTGTGGHGGMPHKLIDPVLIASHLVVTLQQIVSRKAPPEIPTVLSFGKFNAPGATNVIPQKVWLEGTFRTLDEKWRTQAHDEIRQSVNGIVEAMGGQAEVRIVSGYPSLVNHTELTRKMSGFAQTFLGESQVVELPVRMTGEDFARYSQKYPSVFYRLGTGFPDRKNFSVHHPEFEVNEEALRTGMELLAYLCLRLNQL